jgi:hypothetical protein
MSLESYFRHRPHRLEDDDHRASTINRPSATIDDHRQKAHFIVTAKLARYCHYRSIGFIFTMPPKKGNDASKKNVQKKKAQNLEDKTFGLKNKNKSKKVQSLVAQVQNNIMNSGDPKQRKLDEARKQQKANSKLRKKAVKDEQDALFGEALMAVQKKGSTNQKEGKVEALGRDGNDDAKKAGTSRAMKMMFQMDAQEMDQKLREDVRVLIVCVCTFSSTRIFRLSPTERASSLLRFF